jgi:UDP-N-acetylglucosamine diphosphorylase / glucose-1-phosphate thymidylyltransferase / UDP-N-acetylgalactosamine diphosphorylase / glucosamine-1-phosphate N-acetyltransferase / galactosamine-1-phosphate N-acetyltransferase
VKQASVTALYLYEDAIARAFEPFSLTRPVCELMAGAEIIRERWQRVTGAAAAGFIGAAHLAHFDEPGAPRWLGGDVVIPAGSVIANSRFVPSLAVAASGKDGFAAEVIALIGGDAVCAVRTQTAINASAISDSLFDSEPPASSRRSTIAGRWLGDVWDLIGQLGDQLAEDIPHIASGISVGQTADASVIGHFPVYCEAGARVEPFVVLDATAGPILIRGGAIISSFSRIVGPCYIGPSATVMGDAVRACSIGELCKVRGEISNSVMLGHSNKGHTGFVGHSYLGRWVNLGAGTTTSNLKNTYGNVQLWTPGGVRDTGLQFLGTMFGDHVKTGIGTMLTTGTVLGAGANVYGGSTVPKYVAPFAWGSTEPYRLYELEKFITVAARMMERRHVELTERGRKHLATAHAVAGERRT